MRLKWVKVNCLSDGHGVLFIHNAVKRPIAFLVGYSWLRGEPKQITVEVLKIDHLSKEYTNINISKIINESKGAVQQFIKNKVLMNCNKCIGQVRVWYNA